MSLAVHVYPALIKRAESNLENAKRKRRVMQVNGVTSFNQIDLEILEQERILMLLNRSRRDKQGDLFQINVDLNHQ